jgi:uncharacterized protein (DUF1800 family)
MNTANDLWEPWEPSNLQPWNRQRVSHLVRRSGFGVTFAELDRLVLQGYKRTIEDLFKLEGREAFEAEMAPIEQSLAAQQDPPALASWWLLRMVDTPCQFLEKVTFFWHGHFATGAEKVADSVAMLNQYRLLRDNALGSFEALVQGISRDVAMLIYLDSTDNRKTRPNENYAREVMELFCLGPGNYVERDIKELARCFTGWEVRQNRFRFNPYQHDPGRKSFLGRSGPYTGEEAIQIVLDQPATAKFIAKKMVRFFCTDNEVDDAALEPLAKALRDSKFDIGGILRQILTSRFFWSEKSIGQKVRSPVELAIGLIRMLGVSTNMNDLRTRLTALGQLPMFPPNVKGWEGGRTWINASTFVERINLVRRMADEALANEKTLVRILHFSTGSPVREQIGKLVDTMFAVRPPDSTIENLVETAKQSSGSTDEKIRNVLVAMAAIPEFHLC